MAQLGNPREPRLAWRIQVLIMSCIQKARIRMYCRGGPACPPSLGAHRGVLLQLRSIILRFASWYQVSGGKRTQRRSNAGAIWLAGTPQKRLPGAAQFQAQWPPTKLP